MVDRKMAHRDVQVQIPEPVRTLPYTAKGASADVIRLKILTSGC